MKSNSLARLGERSHSRYAWSVLISSVPCSRSYSMSGPSTSVAGSDLADLAEEERNTANQPSAREPLDGGGLPVDSQRTQVALQMSLVEARGENRRFEPTTQRVVQESGTSSTRTLHRRIDAADL